MWLVASLYKFKEIKERPILNWMRLEQHEITIYATSFQPIKKYRDKVQQHERQPCIITSFQPHKEV